MAQSLEQHQLDVLWQLRTLRLAIEGEFAALILHRIVERYGPSELSGEGLDGGPLDSMVQAAGIRAMAYYDAGDYDAAGHVLVPRIERAVRWLASSAAVRVDSSSGVLGLGTVLEALPGVLDEPFRLYLTALLTEPAGLNIRNRVSHGLVDVVDRQTAALLIQALWALRLLSRSDSIGGEAT